MHVLLCLQTPSTFIYLFFFLAKYSRCLLLARRFDKGWFLSLYVATWEKCILWLKYRMDYGILFCPFKWMPQHICPVSFIRNNKSNCRSWNRSYRIVIVETQDTEYLDLWPRVWILSLILRRSRTGTVWLYTSTRNKRAARPKLYTMSLTRDLKLMYSRLTLVRISINL